MIERKKLRMYLLNAITYGSFTLHSGDKSTWICDILKVRDKFNEFLFELFPTKPLVGIEFGGALLAYSWSPFSGIYRKDGSIYLPSGTQHDISLIDDVVTTETSMKEAENGLREIGVNIVERLCILDRRKNPVLEIKSLFTASDFNLL